MALTESSKDKMLVGLCIVGAGRIVADEADLISRLDTLQQIVEVYGVPNQAGNPAQASGGPVRQQAPPSTAQPTGQPSQAPQSSMFSNPAQAEEIRKRLQAGEMSRDEAREALELLR